MPDDAPIKPAIAVLFTGGMHQALHIAPVAAHLAATGAAKVTAFVNTEQDAAALRDLCPEAADLITIKVMRLGLGLGRLKAAGLVKLLRLFRWSRDIRRHAAILTCECTSTILKRAFSDTPPMVHIPHGSGDRAVGYEPRIALFDHVIVSGEKTRQRIIDAGLATPESCTVSGYVKLGALIGKGEETPLFRNGRPIIVYNAHFRPAETSWNAFAEELVQGIADDGAFNLIVAPHVRLFAEASEEERAKWQALAKDDAVIVDLGSERSMDMTYTKAADIYVGDVSSQVYEFLYKPRPCVFLDAHNVDWQNDGNFANWHLGELCRDVPSALSAIANARERHPEYADKQRDAFARSMGGDAAGAPARAAAQLLAAIKAQ